MLDLSFWELALIGIVALLVIGPKELPNALRHMGRITGKARAMTRHVRSGFDEMVRQAEMEEMEKQWRQQNAAIMATHPDVPPDPQGSTPARDAAGSEQDADQAAEPETRPLP